MERYVCVHGHFYQPPRENPWLEQIELQDSAYPYHDWNERIAVECYATNGASRILDGRDRIVEIVNNYSKISFNFGPTLLAWLEAHDPDTYAAVLEADRESRARFSGHGSAMAQAYNHMILPLANPGDRRTQVHWGIRDFIHRFGREPEGMWLPETAVDIPTLEVLAELGIRFTILAPHQAARIRRIGRSEWQDVTGARIDPSRAYRQRLPSGRSIDIFFYDGPISRAVAFEGLLRNGERFAARLTDAFSSARDWPQLSHIATDGETYGHHHRHGEMALSYALRHIVTRKLAQLTNYGEFLERNPPTHEVEILENTSWSCAHGIERWRSDCGCSTGGAPGWNQAWRAPLRAALDWLRDALAPRFAAAGAELFKDPWAARDEYIDVILKRTPENVDRFLAEHATRPLTDGADVRALKLLELQRHAMLMYTSCGWFFNDVSGIETVQVIQYAGRAVQLARECFGQDLEPEFLSRLAQARSNIPERGDGRQLYRDFVQPSMVDPLKVAGHYAIASLFEPYAREARVYCYDVRREERRSFEAGRARLDFGRATITSRITRESAAVIYGVLHLGDHNVVGGVRPFTGDGQFDEVVSVVRTAFDRADFPAVLREFDRLFDGPTYTLKSLFRDEQRRIIDRLLETTLQETEAVYRGVYEANAPLMRFLADLRIPLPNAFLMAAELVINTGLIETFAKEDVDLDRARALLAEARSGDIALDAEGLGYVLEETLESLMARFRRKPDDLDLLERLDSVTDLLESLPFEINLWKSQNLFYSMLENGFQGVLDRAEGGDADAQRWVQRFQSLGEKLGVAVEPRST